MYQKTSSFKQHEFRCNNQLKPRLEKGWLTKLLESVLKQRPPHQCVWAPAATEDRRGVAGHEGVFNDTKRCSSRVSIEDMGLQGCSSCGTTEGTPETLPKQEIPCNKAQCGNCIPTMPPEHSGSNSDMHPAPIRRSRVDDAMTYLWGSLLPFGMGIHCRIHLQSRPCQCNSPQRQLESSYSPYTSSASCAKQDPFGWCHTLQNQKRPHSRLSSRPKRHIQSVHCGHWQQHSKPKKRALLLALGSPAQEVSEIEPLSQDNMEKLCQNLGWLLDFRRTTMTLPDNKFHAYSRKISEMLQWRWTSKGELETNAGWWVHLGRREQAANHN